MVYLYLKKHKTANKFYLGKTEQDPMKYQGSGLYWQKLLKKHGNDVETVVLKECLNNEEVREWGMYYSKLWNIVENDLFANLKEESGDGGSYAHKEKTKQLLSEKAQQRAKDSKYISNLREGQRRRFANGAEGTFKGKKHSEETKQRLRANREGSRASVETKQKMSESQKGRTHSEETKQKMSSSNLKKWERLNKDPFRERMKKLSEQTVECPHCSKVTNKGNAKRWHFENCKRRVSPF